MITYEEAVEILSSDEFLDRDSGLKHDLQSFLIIYSVIPNKDVIKGASHEIIYSHSIGELVEAGITKDQLIQLRKMNWIASEGDLAYFV